MKERLHLPAKFNLMRDKRLQRAINAGHLAALAAVTSSHAAPGSQRADGGVLPVRRQHREQAA